MQNKKLIEKLEDMATFFTLSKSDAGKREKTNRSKGHLNSAIYWEGRRDAYLVAFNKLDKIIKEAKR